MNDDAVTDHAATIRRFANDTDPTGEVVAALDALLAELQQAIDDGMRIKQEAFEREIKLVAERQQLQEERQQVEGQLAALEIALSSCEAERRLAIDALRDAKHCAERGDNRTVIAVVDAVLVKLGESSTTTKGGKP